MGKEVASAAIPAAIFVASGGTIFGLTGFKAFAAMTAVNYGLGQVAQALAPRPALRDIEREAQDITTVSSIDSHKVIYGRTITGGTLVYSNLATNSIGAYNTDFINLVIALAPHEIEGIQKIYVNSDVAIDLELNDEVMDVTEYGIYDTVVQGGVTRTGTVPAGGQINLDGLIYDLLGGTYNYTLVVGGSTVYNNSGSSHSFCYQNTSGSSQSFTLTVSSLNVSANNYTLGSIQHSC